MMAPIRTGIIGFGLAGSVFHGPLLAADPAYRIDAIVTADPGRMSAAARKHPGARILRTPAELWESAGRLDLVVIATATPSHVALAEAAIEAGLNLVIDKPFAVTRADGERLIASAARAGVALTVFQNRRWDREAATLSATRAWPPRCCAAASCRSSRGMPWRRSRSSSRCTRG
jgi:predicted dehydrogenase